MIVALVLIMSSQLSDARRQIADAQATVTAVSIAANRPQANITASNLAIRAREANAQNQIDAITLAVAANRVALPNPPVLAQQILSAVAYPPGPISSYIIEARATVLSSDGSQVATIIRDFSRSFRDVVTGEIVRTFDPIPDSTVDAGFPHSLVFSPDGTAVASGSNDFITIWDAATGEIIQTLDAYLESDMVFSPDGSQLLAQVYSGVVVWEVETGAVIHTVDARTSSIAYTRDGRPLAATRHNGVVTIWDVSTATTYTIPLPNVWVTRAELSPSGHWIVLGGQHHPLILWDIETGTQVQTFTDLSNEVSNLVFSPDGSQLAGSVDDDIIVFDVMTGEVSHILKGHSSPVFGIEFTPDGNHILSTTGRIFILWDLTSRDVVRTIGEHEGRVANVAFSRQGTHIVSKACGLPNVTNASNYCEMVEWNIETGRSRRLYIGYSEALVLNPDGTQLFADESLWDVETGEMIRSFTLPSHQDRLRLTNAAFSHDGLQFASLNASTPGAIIWDVNTGDISQNLGYGTWDADIAFHPDGDRIILGATLWDVTTGEIIRRFDNPLMWTRSIDFSPDGALIIAGSHQDERLQLWNVETGEIIRTFEGHNSTGRDVAFSPDGQWIVSTSTNGTIIIWDVVTGEAIRIYPSQPHSLWSVDFSPDGTQVISGSDDGTLALWRVDRTAEDLIRWTCNNRYVRTLTEAEQQQWGLDFSDPCEGYRES